MSDQSEDEKSESSRQSSEGENVVETDKVTQSVQNGFANNFSGFSALDFVRRSDRTRKSIVRFEPKQPETRARQHDSSEDSEDSSSSDDDDYYHSRKRGRKRRKTEANRKTEEELSRSRRLGSSLRTVQRKSYFESDSDDFMDEHDRAVARAQARQKAQEEEEGDVIELVMDHKMVEGVRQFLIKWRGSAHIHNTWVTENQVAQLKGYKRLTNYIKRTDAYEAWLTKLHPEDKEQENVYREMQRTAAESYTRVDRVICEKEGEGGLQYFVLWENLPYADCTWEDQQDIAEFQHKIDEYLEREDRIKQAKSASWPQSKSRPFTELKKQPPWLAPLELELRDYQLQGVNWLAYSWSRHTNVILADEMGLGKTIQCVVFLGMLSRVRNLQGPFLVVVPLSTLPAWRHEFAKWAPFLNVVTYVGNVKSRTTIRDFEFYQEKGRGGNRKFRLNVLVTTYELAMKDKSYLGSISWKYLLVDEAHRLKDRNSKLYEILNDFKTGNRLLITGTPLQNSLQELWCLLHFLDPKKFGDFDEFEETYRQIDEGKSIGKLHEALRAYLLRRVKKKVLKSLPQKTERILRVQQTPMQRRFYKEIIAKNYDALNKGSKKQSLMNTVMELKKVCNHPFLLPAAEAEGQQIIEAEIANKSSHKAAQLHAIIKNSGKLVLLHKLLERLKSAGNRVLIFSQMVKMLDILAQYLRAVGHQFQRLDGSMPSRDRQQAMEHFNKDGSEDFCFLLSTRAGGLGVNLATADTVVIFDSDWNPQNDLQAMARAHRIGQKRHVNIYRFVTKDTVEEKILERAKKKMILDHLVIQQMDTSGRLTVKKKANNKSGFDCKDLSKILKFGAKKLFDEDRERENKKKEEITATSDASTDKVVGVSDAIADKGEGSAAAPEESVEDMDLDEILSRAETKDNAADETEADELLSQFNVAEFKTNEMDIKVANLEESEDEETWGQIVPDHLIPEDQKGGGEIKFLAPRQRKQVQRYGESYQPEIGEEEEDDEAESEEDEPKPASRKKMSKRAIHQLYKALTRFGNSDHALKWLRETIWKDRKIDEKRILEEAEKIMKLAEDEVKKVEAKKDAIKEENIKAPDTSLEGEHGSAKKQHKLKAHFKYRGQNVDADALILRQREREVLEKELKKLEGQNLMNYRIRAFGLRQVNWRCRPAWGTLQDSMLLLGVYVHGMNAWDDIIEDTRLGLKKYVYRMALVKEKGKDSSPSVMPDSKGDMRLSPSSSNMASGDKDKHMIPKGLDSELKIKDESLTQKPNYTHSSPPPPSTTKEKDEPQPKSSEKTLIRTVKNTQLKTRVLRLLEHIEKGPTNNGKLKKVRPGAVAKHTAAHGSSQKKKSEPKRKMVSKDSSVRKRKKESKTGKRPHNSEKRMKTSAHSSKIKKHKTSVKMEKKEASRGSEKKENDPARKKAIKILMHTQEIKKSLAKLRNKYGKYYKSSNDERGDKARRYILQVGDFIRTESMKNEALGDQFWHIASRSLNKSGKFFQGVYLDLIKR